MLLRISSEITNASMILISLATDTNLFLFHRESVLPLLHSLEVKDLRDIGLALVMEKIACRIEEDKEIPVVYLGPAVDYYTSPVVVVVAAAAEVVAAADHIEAVAAEDILHLLPRMRIR